MTKLRITLKKSAIGHPRNQKETVRSLGLRRLHQSVVHENTPSIRGMINTIGHLVEVETLEEDPEADRKWP